MNRQKRSPMPGHSVRNRQLCAPYFQQQGMTQEEVTQALTQFKQQREAQKPNVSLIEKERDEARRELEAYRQKDILKKHGVDARYEDFVLLRWQRKWTAKQVLKRL